MQVLTVLFFGLIALGVLVFVHELGHFLVAKAAGIRVLKFSLGFGNKLIGFKRGETEYVISALPLGGFVKFAGENPKSEESVPMQAGDWLVSPWWIRLLVLLAGPVMNLITSVLILGVLFWVGFMVPLAKPQVVQIEPQSAAARAGLLPGDVINSLEGQAIDNWETFAKQLNTFGDQSSGRALRLGMVRDGREVARGVAPEKDKNGKWRLGITLAPAATNEIDRVFVGTPAEMAGFKIKDKVTAVAGAPVRTKFDFQTQLRSRAGQPTGMTVERAGRTLELTVTPMAQQLPGQGQVGVIGVNFKISDAFERVAYPFFPAFALGARQTWNMTNMILTSLGHMVMGKISVKDSMGGPITIMRMAGQEAKSGLKDFLFFLAGISVMLAVLNLLPIPVLDGGNAVFFILEGVLRHPVSMKLQEGFQKVGFALLIALMVFATYNDLYKLVGTMLGVKH